MRRTCRHNDPLGTQNCQSRSRGGTSILNGRLLERHLVLFALAVFCLVPIEQSRTEISALAIETHPTFESCSYYVPYADGSAQCRVFYKQRSDATWRRAYTPVFATTETSGAFEFRGSIVGLREETEYDLKVEIWRDGALLDQASATFATWDPTPTIAQTISLASIYSSGAMTISSKIGSNNGWIKIVGDGTTVIDGKFLADQALYVTGSRYLILENLIIRGGSKHGIAVADNCSYIRIINCDISGWGRVPVAQLNSGQFVDASNTVINLDSGILIKDVPYAVIERCFIHDPRGNTNAWDGTTINNVQFSGTHPVGPSGILYRLRNSVIRYNDVVGSAGHYYNDCIQSAQNHVGGALRDVDIYGNCLSGSEDDAIELDGGQMNVRLFGNLFTMSFGGISQAPNTMGPCYVYRNLIANLGDSRLISYFAVKNGGGTTSSKGRQYYFNNTFYAIGGVIVGVGYGGDGTGVKEKFIATSRNNILVSTGASAWSIDDVYKFPDNSFDYDILGNTKASGGRGTIRAFSGAESHGLYGVPAFVNVDQNNFDLNATSLGINSGTVLDNFSDTYLGTAPDHGAFEFGERTLIPYRPLKIIPDKYLVRTAAGVTQTVTLSIGSLSGISTRSFSVRKSNDMNWLTVSPASGVLNENTNLTFTISSNPGAFSGSARGIFFVRLGDGYSIPISVVASGGDGLGNKTEPAFPLNLQGLPPEEETIEVDALKPEGVDSAYLSMWVYDAENVREGAMYVNGMDSLILFGPVAHPASDRVVTALKMRMSATAWKNGKNSLRFVHYATGGFRVDSLAVSFGKSTAIGTEPLGAVAPVFGLEQNYPNPFNPSTTIRYGLPHRSRVTLTVFNTLSQQVVVLQDGEKDAGYHEVVFDASSLPSGVYFSRMQADNFVQTRKLLLVR
jgi:hypothetical protein